MLKCSSFFGMSAFRVGLASPTISYLPTRRGDASLMKGDAYSGTRRRLGGQGNDRRRFSGPMSETRLVALSHQLGPLTARVRTPKRRRLPEGLCASLHSLSLLDYSGQRIHSKLIGFYSGRRNTRGKTAKSIDARPVRYLGKIACVLTSPRLNPRLPAQLTAGLVQECQKKFLQWRTS
jgi:hypothetical protein